MHRSCRVRVQQWLCGPKREPVRELRYGDVQEVPGNQFLHELQRWHVFERRRGYDMHDVPGEQRHARPWKQQRLRMRVQPGLHGPECAPLRGVFASVL